MPSCSHTLAIAPQFLFVLLRIVLFLFCPLLLNISLKHVHLKYDCNTMSIAFPQSSSLHTVNMMGSVILFAGGFLSQIPVKRHDMFINLKKAKTHSCFSRESLFFK